MRVKTLTLLAATTIGITAPMGVSAQDVANTSDPAFASVSQEEDDEFPIGLLGLLGLAGLLGLKRRDDRVHTDARSRP